MKHILEVKNLTVTLAGSKTPLVKDVSFGVHRGRVLGIIGESGCGKTLTCKAIMRLLSQKVFEVGGGIRFQGSDLIKTGKEKGAEIGKDISLIMQNPMTAFDPMSRIGHQMVETVRAHSSVSKKQAYEMGVLALKKMNLKKAGDIMHSYPYMLSGGMLQRVMIAISLMLEPSLVIADEATTALDVNTQAIVLDEFKRMRDAGIALIIVTHDFGVIARLADHVVVMQNGHIVEQGDVYGIFKAPKAAHTKALLDARMLVKEVTQCSA